MKSWFTARELAGLTGLPTTARGVTKRAHREGWQRRWRKASGGGWEYHYTDCPPATRLLLAEQGKVRPEVSRSTPQEVWRAEAAAERAQAAAEEKEKARKAAMIPKDREHTARARLVVLNEANRFVAVSGLNQEDGWKHFAEHYNAGGVDVPDWVREVVRQTSFKSLQRWHTKYRRDGLYGLADRRGRATSAGWRREGILRDFFLGYLREKPHSSGALIWRVLKAYREQIEAAGEEFPTKRTVQQWLRDFKAEDPELWCYISDPDGWRSKHMVAYGSASETIVRLNQLWEMDSTPTDVILSDGRRHALVGVIDVYSRRAMLLVSRSSTGAAISGLLRRALSQWGVPEIIRTDNGQDYVSRQVSWVLQTLEVERDLCPPFAPEKKPHIERFFGTFSRDLAVMSGYVGHDVAERERIRAQQSFADRLMKRGSEPITLGCSPEELQAWCDAWCVGDYEQRPHGGLGGRRPLEMATSWTTPVRKVPNERALDLLLTTAAGGDGMRTVTKKGLRADGRRYIGADLAALVGHRVQLRHDEQDAGRGYVFDEDGNFLCLVYDELLEGLDRRALAREAKRVQKARLSDGVSAMDPGSRREEVEEAARRLHQQRLADAAAVVAFPQANEEHESDGLSALDVASRADELVPSGGLDEAMERRVDERMARIRAGEEPERVVREETREERFERWYRLRLRQHRAPETLTEREVSRVAVWAEHPECITQCRMNLSFNGTVDGEPVERELLEEVIERANQRRPTR